MAEVNGTPPPATPVETPEVSPFLMIVVTDAGPTLKTNIQDGGMLVALLEQTKGFVLSRMFPPPVSPIVKPNGLMNRIIRR